MSERVVVYSVVPDAEPTAGIAQKLRDNGVSIIEQQEHSLLVSGDQKAIAGALSGASGWKAGDETIVPPPQTRVPDPKTE